MSNIINMSISKIFIPNSLCVFPQIKDRKHIEQNFHSVARVMPRGGTCGCLEGVKTLAWGFAMAPHRLRALLLLLLLLLLLRVATVGSPVNHHYCIKRRAGTNPSGNSLAVLLYVYAFCCNGMRQM